MPKIVDPVQKRTELIGAGWNLIAREGLELATMRRVAEEAGCTTGMLTHYFADRQELLREALRMAHEQAADRMRIAASRAQDEYARLRAVVLESLPLDDERLREWRIWLAFWAASMSSADLAAENESRYLEWRGTVLALLRPLCSDGATAESECEMMVALVDGLGIGIARHVEEPATLNARQEQCLATITDWLERLARRTAAQAQIA